MVNWPQVSVDTEKEFNMCFGCGQDNPIGLKLNFKWDGRIARAEFTPTKLHQGWSGIIHGGIIGCLLDEAMGYASFFQGIKTITAKMQLRLRRLAVVDEPLIITSSITKNTRRLVETNAKISLKDGTPIAEGTATQFIINTKPSRTSDKEGKPKSNVQR